MNPPDWCSLGGGSAAMHAFRTGELLMAWRWGSGRYTTPLELVLLIQLRRMSHGRTQRMWCARRAFRRGPIC